MNRVQQQNYSLQIMMIVFLNIALMIVNIVLLNTYKQHAGAFFSIFAIVMLNIGVQYVAANDDIVVKVRLSWLMLAVSVFAHLTDAILGFVIGF